MKLLEFSISEFKPAWNWLTCSKTVWRGGRGRIDEQSGCTSTISLGNQSQMRAGNDLKRSATLSACPKAGAALPTSVLTDVCLPCIRYWIQAWEDAQEMRKLGDLQNAWQALPWAWHCISQHLETWEHLLSKQGEQSSVTSSPSICILILCGWLHCHQHDLGGLEYKWLHNPCKHPSVLAHVAVFPYANCQGTLMLWSKAVHCRVMSLLPHNIASVAVA